MQHHIRLSTSRGRSKGTLQLARARSGYPTARRTRAAILSPQDTAAEADERASNATPGRADGINEYTDIHIASTAPSTGSVPRL
eukprot:2847369-Pleurochrysis_carterae.AAC.2